MPVCVCMCVCVRAHFGDRPNMSRSAFAATVLVRAMVYCRLHVSDVSGFVYSCCVWSLLCAFVELSVLFMYTREVFLCEVRHSNNCHYCCY